MNLKDALHTVSTQWMLLYWILHSLRDAFEQWIWTSVFVRLCISSPLYCPHNILRPNWNVRGGGFSSSDKMCIRNARSERNFEHLNVCFLQFFFNVLCHFNVYLHLHPHSYMITLQSQIQNIQNNYSNVVMNGLFPFIMPIMFEFPNFFNGVLT